jgi:hypothetical protein
MPSWCLVSNPAPWPSGALLEAVMRACAAPPDRSGILRPRPPFLLIFTASCHACVGWCGAPSRSRSELPVPLGGARAGANAVFNAANNILKRALEG